MALQSRDRRVVHVRDADPSGPRDPHKAVQPTRVVGVRVREHHPVQLAYAGTRERLPQDQWIGAGVDKYRVVSVPDEDRVPLADVEHLDEPGGRVRER